MPAVMRERMETMLSDPDILSLIPNLAVIDARVEEVLSTIGVGPAEAWEQALKAARAVQHAKATGNVEQLGRAVDELVTAVQDGGSARDALREIWDLFERRRRIQESEVKRRASETDSITMEQATALMMWLVDVMVTEGVPKQTVGRIVGQIRALPVGRSA